MFDLNTLIHVPPLERVEGGFSFGFKTKSYGDARDEKVRSRLRADMKAQRLISPRQSHGSNIIVVSKDTPEPTDDADGVITTEPDILLTVMTADCVPMIFLDRSQRVIGISHQGWKGSYARMAQKMIGTMLEAGARIEHIECHIGPAISGDVYDVPKDRYKLFRQEFFPYAHLFARQHDGRFYLDLPELNVQQALEAGVSITSITKHARCTFSEREHFYSYRRDTKAEFGEMISYVMML